MASMRWAGEDFPAGESTAEVTIDVPSVESGSQAHDDHLRSAGFFDVARHHPAATFAGRATGRRGRRGLLAGELTSRGVTRPVARQADTSVMPPARGAGSGPSSPPKAPSTGTTGA